MAPSFPSPLERTVASALLLLSATNQPPSLSSPLFDTDGELLLKSKSRSDEESVSLVPSGDSKRCGSSVTSEDGSSNEIRAHKLRIIAVVARCHEMKLKVMRKSRSKINRKFKSGKPPPKPTEKPDSSGSVSTEAGSCLSSSASAVSSARSRYLSPEESSESVVGAAREKPRRKTTSTSSHIQRRAEAILKLLSSGGCSSEIKIRQVLGDSPDTSKALRMLLKTDEVKRSGTGGRQDPYIYAALILLINYYFENSLIFKIIKFIN